mmetsp:Transcript_16151/g.23436  ORF Transcript_16151/g.23436 Transcript_16151/m.23436 type:complete len:170 (-) Transcript_16151:2889-3398(-)
MTLSKIKAFQQISNNHIFNLSKVDTHSESSDANSLVDKESFSWIWYNDPLEWGYLDNSSDLFVKVPPKSDCWQNSYYPNGKGGYQADNAPFYHTTIDGSFVATVQFSGQYLHLYDQTGIMVRSSSTNWMKCGVEFTSNVQHASTVITRDGFSDWSILAIQPLNPESVVF